MRVGEAAHWGKTRGATGVQAKWKINDRTFVLRLTTIRVCQQKHFVTAKLSDNTVGVFKKGVAGFALARSTNLEFAGEHSPATNVKIICLY